MPSQLNNEILPKTDEFLANTAILYMSKYIATWNLGILAYKMVHEMFHAYQKID